MEYYIFICFMITFYLSARFVWLFIAIICGVGALFDPFLIIGGWTNKVWAIYLWNCAQILSCSIPCCTLIPYTSKVIEEINEERIEIARQQYVIICQNHTSSLVSN